MDQGLGPERLRRPAEGAIGPGGQRQRGQGTIKTTVTTGTTVICLVSSFLKNMNNSVVFKLFPCLIFVLQVKKAFQGRVTLPGYNENRYNASLALSGLRSSDSGLYRCEVVVGINDEQDTVPLEVTGE